MFKHMRRLDRQATAEDTVKILEKCEYGVLSTVNQDSYPYGVPLSYVYKDGSIYFHSAGEGYKLDNIAINSKVSFCVVGDKKSLPEKFTTNYESVIIFGQASQVQGQEKKEALLALIAKYAPDHMEQGTEYVQKQGDRTTVIKVAVEHMTGKVRS
ncbi:pyridoxamine 5'-phosphate oxidase family protein [Sporomusa sp.]|uniref:pyridoxamine 5'-phosphate oxidase family protein n=1 Tax=Sporomusa sp. TaxID=2078658 RepID=UPI002BB579A2|nr:pyridoxamine 5'-phosphate oxidase family protein [Sporomusa sp.]HWR43977.1 pyridoxamine 5'-phosphate oxidase family protein [Sporomusa sp.]